MSKPDDISLRVSIPAPLMSKYELQAKAANHTLEQELSNRLLLYADADSQKPLVINDASRQRLERLLGRNVSSIDSLVQAMERALQIQAASTEIPLTPHVLERLHTRCLGMPFDKFIKMTVTRLLEEFVGVR